MGIVEMHLFTKAVAAAALVAAPVLPLQLAAAGVGDLLVAPTRLVLNGGRSAEVILNNIGEEPATYRISAEFRRMNPDGTLEEVAEPTQAENAARDMLIFAPRRVTLAPREPQSIRIAARPPAGLPDGEYRIHLLFRAVPPATPVAKPASEPAKGLSFKLTPIYGVTIPVIVRLGNLDVKAAISNVRVERRDGKPVIALDVGRTGGRSTFGEVRVLKSGVKDPIAQSRAVAVYTELNQREVVVPVDEAFTGDLTGPVTVQYVESFDDGTKTLAETQAVLR
ncbi:MAG TPA: molecular chaperone [Sphingomicrobium sp.]|nr:molecular chaperone [Sphingomicrobium sp.]